MSATDDLTLAEGNLTLAEKHGLTPPPVFDAESGYTTLYMGPQHPATHGVLQVILTLEGERIVNAEPVVGFLHRGKEKHGEELSYNQWIVFTDRLDYVSSMANNIGYALAVEKLLGIELTERCKYLRMIICELTRIASHLIWIGTSAIDLGAITIYFLSFKEREEIYDIFDEFSGLRMNNMFVRFGGLAGDIRESTVERIGRFTETFQKTLDECERLLTTNRIWWERTRDVATVSAEDAIALGLTGPNLRGSGPSYDLRKEAPYLAYDEIEFDVAVGTRGDAYDRYLVRLEEMRQSCRILKQAVEKLPGGPLFTDEAKKYILPPKSKVYSGMEELIHQFKIVTDLRIPPGEAYVATEVPKGELGFYIASRGGTSAHRMRIRSPSFTNLQALPAMAKGRLIADMTAIIGSLDFVMGEVDR
jgi:NADH-quinone oxidoreductase subunit D